MNGEEVAPCLQDQEAEEEFITWREEVVNDQALVDKMKLMIMLHRINMEEEEDMLEDISQSLTRVKRGFDKLGEEMKKTLDLINSENVVLCHEAGEVEGEKVTPDSLLLGEKMDKPSYLMNATSTEVCLKDGEAEEKIDITDSLQLGEKREKSPDLKNGEKGVSCLKNVEPEKEMDTPKSRQLGKKMDKPAEDIDTPDSVQWGENSRKPPMKPPDPMNWENSYIKDGEVEVDIDTQDFLQMAVKMIKPPDLSNVIKGVSCLKDEKAKEEIDATYFPESRGKVVRSQQHHWTKEDISEDELFLPNDLRFRKYKKKILIQGLTLALPKKPP